MRDPRRIDRLCNELKVIWSQVPDWRFTQLISNISNAWNVTKPNACDTFYVEDEEFIKFAQNILSILQNPPDMAVTTRRGKVAAISSPGKLKRYTPLG